MVYKFNVTTNQLSFDLPRKGNCNCNAKIDISIQINFSHVDLPVQLVTVRCISLMHYLHG